LAAENYRVTAFDLVTAFFRHGPDLTRQRFGFFVHAEFDEDLRCTQAGGKCSADFGLRQGDVGKCGEATTRSPAAAIGVQARPNAEGSPAACGRSRGSEHRGARGRDSASAVSRPS
jgi:hypothetical protein